MLSSGGSSGPTGPSSSGGSLGEQWRPWILLGLGLLGVGIACWRPLPAGVWHDDGTYMLIAKALSEGHGFVYQGVAGTPPATKFPPGYPLTLAALWTLTGSIGMATLAATLLNVGFLAAAGALFGRLLHRTAGLPLGLSLAVAATGFVSTDVMRTALIPLSEPLFLLLLALTLSQWPNVLAAVDGAHAVAEGGDGETSAATPGVQWRLLVAPAVCLLALVATRSAGLAVVLAFGAALLLPRPSGVRLASTALMTGPALLFLFGWGRWSNAATGQIPEGALDLLGSYQGWLADQLFSAPTVFLGDLPSHTIGVFGRAIALLVPAVAGTPMWIIGWALLALAAIGTVVLIRHVPPVGWLIVAYLVMLLLWPYLDRRLLVPLHPLLVSAIAVGGLALIERISSKAGRNIFLGAAALWLLGYATVTAYRVADGWPTAPYRVSAENLAAAVEAMNRTVPGDAIVGAPEYWAALHLHGGWTTAPSTRFDPRSMNPEAPMWGTPDEQLALWRDAGIDHLLLEQGGQLHGAALDQLEEECPGSVLVLARMRVAMVVKLDWASSCRPTPSSTPRSP